MMARDRKRLKRSYSMLGCCVGLRRGTRSFWMTLAILFLTGMVFVGVYMFIKVTSWSGYSARAVRRAAAAQEL